MAPNADSLAMLSNALALFLLTSMRAQERVVGDGTRLCKRVEFIEPLSRDVELEQAGFLHVGEGNHLLTFPHSLFAALPKGRKAGGRK